MSALTEPVTELESCELETAVSLTSTINKLRCRVWELEGNCQGAHDVSRSNVPDIHCEVVRYLHSSGPGYVTHPKLQSFDYASSLALPQAAHCSEFFLTVPELTV